MKLLMHMCCGPCSTFPLEQIRQEGIEPVGVFFNPNIHPVEEFKRRKENVDKFAKAKDLHVRYFDDFDQSSWEFFEGEDDLRCTMCYDIRFEKMAQLAKEGGYDAFTTTLLVSPYQKHDLIRTLGEKHAARYGVQFYYRDYRPGFRQGQQMARDMDLYRQKYCGCIISLGQR